MQNRYHSVTKFIETDVGKSFYLVHVRSFFRRLYARRCSCQSSRKLRQCWYNDYCRNQTRLLYMLQGNNLARLFTTSSRQWRSKVGAGPCARTPKGPSASSPHTVCLGRHSDGPACTARLFTLYCYATASRLPISDV